MTKKQFRTRMRLLIILSLLLLGLIGFAVGKYVGTTEVGNTVKFSANLVAENGFVLQEHYAAPQSSGAYVLHNGAEISEGNFLPDTHVENNEYILLPGYDIPKDPHIIIQGKTDIPAYLFVEVVDTKNNDAIFWEMTGNWRNMNIPDRNVYVYKTNEEDPAVLLTGDYTIQILRDNQIRISDTLLNDGDFTTGALTFHATLVEKVGDATELQAFNGY